MSDLERWINLEGPAPEDMRRLLEAAQDVPPLTPEHQERLDRELDRALAEERRRWERRRVMARVGVATAAVAALAAGIALARRPPPDDPVADQPVQTDGVRARELPKLSEPVDAGPPRRPKRR